MDIGLSLSISEWDSMVWTGHSWVATRPSEHGWGAPHLGLLCREPLWECAGANAQELRAGVCSTLRSSLLLCPLVHSR